VKSCRFLPLSTDLTTTYRWFDFQATECLPGYRLFGGVCYGIAYCQKYTQYGLCKQCADGYYVDTQGSCNPCLGNN
jgi:hypothetical protein